MEDADYAERTYIWGSVAFAISEDAAFVIGDDGKRSVTNFSILPLQLVQPDAKKEDLQNNNRSISTQTLSIEAQIAQIDDQIEKNRIVSPIFGTVLTKYAEQGELASQGRVIFKVADLTRIYLRAYVTAGQLTQLKMGQQVNVYADSGDKDRRKYTGKITWISDNAEFTPKTIQTRDERANLVYAVKISVKNDGYIKRGMYGDVNFQH